MDRKRITEANRIGWEQAAPLHRAQNFAGLAKAFRRPGHSCLDEIETAVLRRIGVRGRDVAQLCCNNGRELLSVKNLGAGRCVGFDAARGFIDQAAELNRIAGLDCAFVRTDVYDIGETYSGQFDLVTITIGVLGWMPELAGFFAVAARLLRPGGRLFVYEQHPILNMIEPGPAGRPVGFDQSYFRPEPFVETDGLDYYGGGTYDSAPLTSFSYPLGTIVNAVIASGLALESLEELPGHISNLWWNVAAKELGLPMSFTLLAARPG